MTPEEAVRHVESRDIFGMRFGLERMTAVLGELGDPQLRAPAIHIVGTNGKSSTTRMAAAIAHAHGHRVGAYVSPHVVGWAERMMVDGAPITPQRFADAIERVCAAADRVLGDPSDQLTQFELLTAAAFVAFAAADVDLMVIEAGLGGRYDATNVFDGPACVVLTGVALEHTELLGTTEAGIAAEKLAVCPDGFDRLVVGRLASTAETAVRAILADRRLAAWFVGSDVVAATTPTGKLSIRTPHAVYDDLVLGPLGDFQHDNAACAVAAVERVRTRSLDADAVRVALSHVHVPGRMEIVATSPLVVFDGAHNPQGMAALTAALPAVIGERPAVALIGVFADKDIDAMAVLLSTRCDRAVVTRPSSSRAADPERVAAALTSCGVAVEIASRPPQALARARELAGENGAVVACGSLGLLADLRADTTRAHVGLPGMLAAGNIPEIVNKTER